VISGRVSAGGRYGRRSPLFFPIGSIRVKQIGPSMKSAGVCDPAIRQRPASERPARIKVGGEPGFCLFHATIEVGHVTCFGEPFLAAALTQRPSRPTVKISNTGVKKRHGPGMTTGFAGGFWSQLDVDSLHSDASFLSKTRNVWFANSRNSLLWVVEST
jgi:hypothetical protein